MNFLKTWSGKLILALIFILFIIYGIHSLDHVLTQMESSTL